MKQSQRISVIVDPVEFSPSTLNLAINFLIFGQTLKKLSRKGTPLKLEKVTRSMRDSIISTKRSLIFSSMCRRRRICTKRGSICVG